MKIKVEKIITKNPKKKIGVTRSILKRNKPAPIANKDRAVPLLSFTFTESASVFFITTGMLLLTPILSEKDNLQTLQNFLGPAKVVPQSGQKCITILSRNFISA